MYTPISASASHYPDERLDQEQKQEMGQEYKERIGCLDRTQLSGAKRAFNFTWLAASKQLCGSTTSAGFGWRSSRACNHHKRHANASNQWKCPAIDGSPGLPTPAHLTTVCTSLVRPRTEAIGSQIAQRKKIFNYLKVCESLLRWNCGLNKYFLILI